MRKPLFALMLSIIDFLLHSNNAHAANYFTLPIDTPNITSGYSDLRIYDDDGLMNDVHGGIDYATAATGTSIYAVASFFIHRQNVLAHCIQLPFLDLAPSPESPCVIYHALYTPSITSSP